MGEDQSGGEHGFQGVESRLAVIRPEPRSIFSGMADHQSDNIRVSMDEMAVEIGESKERLYVFNLLQSGPFLYGFNFSMSIESPVGDNTNPRYSMVSV